MTMNKPPIDPSPFYPSRRFNIADVAQDEDDDAIDLRALFFTMWRGKWIILICMLFGAFLGYVASSQYKPVYRASAKVMFGLEDANVTNLQQVISDQQYDITELEDQMQVLRSTVLLERVISKLVLDEDPEFNPFLREVAPTLFERVTASFTLPPEVTDMARNMGLLSPPAPVRHAAEVRRVERLAILNSLSNALSLAPVGQSRVIQITVQSANPRTAERVANSIAEEYLADQLSSKVEAFRSANQWLSTRVDELRGRVQEDEEAIERARSALSEESGQSLEITRSQLNALNAAQSQSRVAISRAQALYERLSAALDQNRNLGAISEFRASPLIQNYRQQEATLLDQRAELLFTFSEDNPALQRIDERLQRVRDNIAFEANLIVQAAELEMRATILQDASLMREVRKLENKAYELSANQLELRQLAREAEASRVLYENFLGRLQETNAQQDLQEADARILSPAERPLRPEQQNVRRTQIIGTLLGVMAGVGLVFLIERLNNSFRWPGQLEEVTGERLLGVLPAIGRRMQRAEVIRYMRDKPASALVEAVRNLRTSVLFSDIDNPPRVVMFTSSVPREGKSTTSMLVAMTSQQMGKSAIIVDCDLRLPQLAALVNADNRKFGLLSLLEGESDIEETVVKDNDTGLHILTTVNREKSGMMNAADVLSSRRFEELIKKLSEVYDLVVLDTPPALVVADARIISRIVDAVVYLVRWDDTPRGAVMEGLKELRSVNAPIAGVVMTQVNEGRAARYAYHGYNYYKGQYRSYYRQ